MGKRKSIVASGWTHFKISFAVANWLASLRQLRRDQLTSTTPLSQRGQSCKEKRSTDSAEAESHQLQQAGPKRPNQQFKHYSLIYVYIIRNNIFQITALYNES